MNDINFKFQKYWSVGERYFFVNVSYKVFGLTTSQTQKPKTMTLNSQVHVDSFYVQVYFFMWDKTLCCCQPSNLSLRMYIHLSTVLSSVGILIM